MPVLWRGPSRSFPATLLLTHGHLRCSLQVHCHFHLCRHLCSPGYPELSLITLSCVHLSTCSSPSTRPGYPHFCLSPMMQDPVQGGRMRGKRITLSVYPCKGKQSALRHSFRSQKKMLSRMSVIPNGTYCLFKTVRAAPLNNSHCSAGKGGWPGDPATWLLPVILVLLSLCSQ